MKIKKYSSALLLLVGFDEPAANVVAELSRRGLERIGNRRWPTEKYSDMLTRSRVGSNVLFPINHVKKGYMGSINHSNHFKSYQISRYQGNS